MVPHSTDEDALSGAVAKLARAMLKAPPPSSLAMHRAKLLLLDAIGCGLIGARELVSLAVAKTCTRPGECLSFVQGRNTAILDAVLTNGVCIRALDFNDYLVTFAGGEPETGGHPSDNIPVALAAGSAAGRTGAEILASLVTGYELYARLQVMMDREGPWDNVCASGIVAPAIAGTLIGLDEAKMAHALALGLSRAATPAIVRRENLSAAKTLTNALIAQAGVQAALLAQTGVTGPLAILDSAAGLRHLFARYDPALLTQALPAEGAIMRAHMKAYPCVNTGQNVVAAALALRMQLRDDPATCSHIELIMPDYAILARQQNDPARNHPASREAADHSFPFLAAVSLIDGAFGLAQFENERWRDLRVTALMEKFAMRRDPNMKGSEAHPFPCRIEATDKEGRRYTAESPQPGAPFSTALSEASAIGKFHSNLAALIPRPIRDEIVDAAMEFDQCPSAEKLNTAIARGAIAT
jgi:2-methylcitrate dehydratase